MLKWDYLARRSEFCHQPRNPDFRHNPLPCVVLIIDIFAFSVLVFSLSFSVGIFKWVCLTFQWIPVGYLVGSFSGLSDESWLRSATPYPNSENTNVLRPPVVYSICLCLGVHITFSYHVEFLLYVYWKSSFILCLVKSNLTRAYINRNVNEVHWLDVPKTVHIQSLAFCSLTHSSPWISMLYRLWAIRNIGEAAHFKITRLKKGHWCWALSRLCSTLLLLFSH